MRGGAVVAALVGAVFVLSGCQYLFGLNGLTPPVAGSFDPGAFGSFDPSAIGSFDPGAIGSFDPGAEDSLPPPLATYVKGTASITIGGAVTKLDRLTEPAALYVDAGAEASWTDGKGMYVEFYSDPTGSSGSDGVVQLDRISGGQHLATIDPSSCVVTVKQADAHGLAGTASCKGLRWTDTMSGFNGLEPSPVPGEAPFDAEITFEAAP